MQKIAIHSVPRSGSTWLGNIFNSHPNVCFRYQPLFSYAFKGFLNKSSSKIEIDRFFKQIKNSEDAFINQQEGIKKGIIPRFKKAKKTTHIVYKEVRYHHILTNLLKQDENIKVIGLVRNPFATISSWLHAPKEFKSELGWKVEEEWRFAFKKNLSKPEEFNGFEKWKQVTQLFIDLETNFPDRFYLLHYDDLLKNTGEEVENLFSFCGMQKGQETLDFLEESSNKNDSNAYSVFKEKTSDDGWKNELPNFIIDNIKNDPEFKEINDYFHWI